MALTLWFNQLSDRRITTDEVAELQRRAECLYRTNSHIFEDAREALAALGAIPLAEHLQLLGC